MAVLDVLKMGNPSLREVCKPVDIADIQTAEFQAVVTDMIDTQRSANGAGIAGPQVGLMKRVFTIENNANPRYPEKENFELTIAINPKITPLSDVMIDSWEGCLSIPNIRGKLRRYYKIRLEAYDLSGEHYNITLEGFAAVVAQHELDHLDGILFIDRMDNMATLSFREEYEKYLR